MSHAMHASRLRLAVVFHGKVGDTESLLGEGPRPVRAFDNARASPHMVALCAISALRYVIEPNRRAWRIDIFGHSWSPSVGQVLDGILQPLRSSHESSPALRCPSPSTFSAGYCMRTVSHLLGIARAMSLKQREERAGGFQYNAVYLSRWDVLWQQPFVLGALPGWSWEATGRHNHVWLPRICAPVLGGHVGHALRASVCGGANSHWSAPQAANECAPGARACAPDMSKEAREIYEMDWWIVFGSSADADIFASEMTEKFSEIGTQVAGRLSTNRRGVVAMGHAWFGVQLLWRMRATVHHALNIGVEFFLGRGWKEFRCMGLSPSPGKRVCDAGDVIRRPWQQFAPNRTAWVAGNLPAPATYPRASSMASSCEDHFFYCERGSRMCIEFESELHPFERTPAKALFMGCAEGLCGDGRFAPINSTRCAGALIDIFLQVADSRSNASSSGPSSGGRPAVSRRVAAHETHEYHHVHGPALQRLRLLSRRLLGEELMVPRPRTCQQGWESSQGGALHPRFKALPIKVG